MSTYWGYVCRSHDPELESEHWFNHGSEELRDAAIKERAGEWPNDFTEPWEEPAAVVGKLGPYQTRAPIFWLREHPKCDVALRNEYGDTEELDR